MACVCWTREVRGELSPLRKVGGCLAKLITHIHLSHWTGVRTHVLRQRLAELKQAAVDTDASSSVWIAVAWARTVRVYDERSHERVLFLR